MELVRSERFKRAYRRLEEEVKELVRKALRQLQMNRAHPGLRIKRVQGTDHVWEMRAGRDIRVTFEVEGDVYTLRNAGHHDATLRRP